MVLHAWLWAIETEISATLGLGSIDRKQIDRNKLAGSKLNGNSIGQETIDRNPKNYPLIQQTCTGWQQTVWKIISNFMHNKTHDYQIGIFQILQSITWLKMCKLNHKWGWHVMAMTHRSSSQILAENFCRSRWSHSAISIQTLRSDVKTFRHSSDSWRRSRSEIVI